MLKLRRRLSFLLRTIAEWLYPLQSQNITHVTAALALIRRAELFDAGTSGEFKRQWCLHRLKKQFPEERTRDLALAIEQAVQLHAQR